MRAARTSIAPSAIARAALPIATRVMGSSRRRLATSALTAERGSTALRPRWKASAKTERTLETRSVNSADYQLNRPPGCQAVKARHQIIGHDPARHSLGGGNTGESPLGDVGYTKHGPADDRPHKTQPDRGNKGARGLVDHYPTGVVVAEVESLDRPD